MSLLRQVQKKMGEPGRWTLTRIEAQVLMANRQRGFSKPISKEMDPVQWRHSPIHHEQGGQGAWEQRLESDNSWPVCGPCLTDPRQRDL